MLRVLHSCCESCLLKDEGEETEGLGSERSDAILQEQALFMS